eukprot:7211522-Pyramimonas_sp.AAC.1
MPTRSPRAHQEAPDRHPRRPLHASSRPLTDRPGTVPRFLTNSLLTGSAEWRKPLESKSRGDVLSGSVFRRTP